MPSGRRFNSPGLPRRSDDRKRLMSSVTDLPADPHKGLAKESRSRADIACSGMDTELYRDVPTVLDDLADALGRKAVQAALMEILALAPSS